MTETKSSEEQVYFQKILETHEVLVRHGKWFMSFHFEIMRRVLCSFKWIGFRYNRYPYCGDGTWTRWLHITLFNHNFSFCLSKGKFDGTNRCNGG